jgi:hypothetical protein
MNKKIQATIVFFALLLMQNFTIISMNLEEPKYVAKKFTNKPIRLVIINNTTDNLEFTQLDSPFSKTILPGQTNIEDYKFKPESTKDSLFALFFQKKASNNLFEIAAFFSIEDNFSEYHAQVTKAKGHGKLHFIATTPVMYLPNDTLANLFYNIIVDIKGNEANNFQGTAIVSSVGPQKM